MFSFSTLGCSFLLKLQGSRDFSHSVSKSFVQKKYYLQKYRTSSKRAKYNENFNIFSRKLINIIHKIFLVIVG